MADQRWDAYTTHAVHKMTDKHQEVSGETRLQYVDDMELSLGDVVDDRRSTAASLTERMCENSRATVVQATEQFAVLAGALASAEASRFSTGSLMLEDYAQHVDGRHVVSGTGDLAKKLARGSVALAAAIAACASDDVRTKVSDAAALVAALGERPTSAAHRKRRAPDALLLATHLVRRLRSILARFARVEEQLRDTIAGLGANLKEMAAARMRVEHKAIATHSAAFRAAVRAGQIAFREIVLEDDGIEVPPV